MLCSLQINNYALIEKLEIDFNKGLTIITGETGAGKSILLGALSLILGARADTMVLKNKELKCVVEGTFNKSAELLSELLRQNEIEQDDLILIRREIYPNGKSRAFVNDTPINVSLLKEIGEKLVDIHSQFENLELHSNAYQLMVVDAFAGNNTFLEEYRQSYTSMKNTSVELSGIKADADKAKAELDFLTYQFKELEEAHLTEGEQGKLEYELEVLQHAEEIKSGLFSVWMNISGEEVNAISLIKTASTELAKTKNFYRFSGELQNRIESVIIELKDIASEAETKAEETDLDPLRLEWIQNRLDMIFSLQQKHRLKSVEELIALKNEMDNRISQLHSLDFRLAELEKDLSQKKNIVWEKAAYLSENRRKSHPQIENLIVELLIQLGIPNARFKINAERSENPGEYGIDSVMFLFTANRKTDLQDISRIASGGELSRLMLGIKYIISGKLGLPTIIFDEIDAGVSGEIASRVGGILKEMSTDRQIFTITHLPQVAAKGEHHYLVFKKETEAGTSTGIKLLTNEDRVSEIAKMLSGEETTGAAVENARELMGIKILKN